MTSSLQADQCLHYLSVWLCTSLALTVVYHFSELVQEDKDKLSGRVQKLATDLDLSREQIANKNKENLKVSDESMLKDILAMIRKLEAR